MEKKLKYLKTNFLKESAVFLQKDSAAFFSLLLQIYYEQGNGFQNLFIKFYIPEPLYTIQVGYIKLMKTSLIRTRDFTLSYATDFCIDTPIFIHLSFSLR
jgi:hypothetical protein